tara:strand:+ start:163 stop:1713 length:1551 start_codon:yes stop_codon:yes gene_type:complete
MKLAVFTYLAIFIFTPPLAWTATNSAILNEINHSLDIWDIKRAKVLINTLKKDYSENQRVHFLDARLAFMNGSYEAASNLLNNYSPGNSQLEQFKILVDNTHKVTKNFKMRESQHFQFYFIDKSDEILVHYATKTLEKSYTILGRIFNFYPEKKIRVEFYPSRESLSKISPLTMKDIMNSGTVALCKYNRIMALSPASLYRGYNFMDTLSHEYIHYVITRKSKNTVPLWLHEGLAKFYETRWRESIEPLTPMMETALARGLKSNYLIELNDMMPSFARLKNVEDVQLAYAQVSSMIDFMSTMKRETFVSKLIENLAHNDNIELALKNIFGVSLNKFQENWKKFASKKNYHELPGLKTLQFQFKNKRNEKKARKEISSIGSKKVRNLIYLGDILKSRNHLDAATIEYEKAIEGNETLSPIIYNKLASTLMLIRNYSKAEPLLHKSLRSYPMFHTTLVNLGELYSHYQKPEKSANYFEKAASLNPFNPLVHIRLIELYKQLGLKSKKEIQSQLLKFLE